MPDCRPYITMKILNRKYPALIDTGAMLTFVSDEVAKYLEQSGVHPTKTKLVVNLANDQRAVVEKLYYIKCTIDEREVSISAVYLPHLSASIVLGMDVIQILDLVQINLKGRSLPKLHANTPTPTSKLEVAGIKALTTVEEEHLALFLQEELSLFNNVKGRTPLVQHEIRLKSQQPLKQRYYPRNPAIQDIMKREVSQMIAEDIIEPSRSPWSSPVVLIKKPTGKYRFCIDFRRVNEVSIKDAYPLPYISGVLNKLKEANYISTIDLKNGYWQIPLHPDSKPITAFTVPGIGLYQFKVMPFGLHSAPATFQRLLDRIIGPELENKAFAYLDDIIVLGKTFKEHLDLLKDVFRRLRQAGLVLNPEKCQFGKKELRYLGHIVSESGIQTDPEKVQGMVHFPAPKNVRSLRSFLGLISWYRRFIKNFAKISAPLTYLLKKSQRWEWNSEQQIAFETLKGKLQMAPILACPEFNTQFTLQVDASDFGLGAALTQKQGGKEVAIAFASRLLTLQERKFSTTEKECLALVWGIKTFRPYLEGYHFKAITDHQALKWLLSLKEPSGRLGRWILEIQQYDFEICYRKGINNSLADALSRFPPTEDSTKTKISIMETNLTAEQHASNSWYDSLFARTQKENLSTFRIKDDRLYKKITPRKAHYDPATVWKLCVSEKNRTQVLSESHNEPTAGHLGIRKTIARVGQRYYWPRWKTDVWKYVQKCHNCQSQKPEQKLPMGTMSFREPKGPWYTVCADLIGPFPRSTKGYRFALVLQDTFTKWIEVAPLRNATAREVKDKFQDLILFRYGSPGVILTDNGSQFTSKLFGKITDEWKIRQVFTAPYSPQSNPTERSNRVLKTMIRQFISENHKHWDRHLNEFRLAINSAVHDSTGYSPALLNFGRELKLPLALHETSYVEGNTTTDSVSDRLSFFKNLYSSVKENLKRAFTSQAKYYNLRRRTSTLQPGQQVMARRHDLSSAAQNYAAKLAPKFEGPYTILKREGENIYQLQTDKGILKRVHVKDLKLFM